MNCHDTLPIYHVPADATIVWVAQAIQANASPLQTADVLGCRVDVLELQGNASRPIDIAGSYINDGSPFDTPYVDGDEYQLGIVYDSWQHGGEWKEDSRGFNIRYQFALPTPSKTYHVKLTFTLVTMEVLVVDALFVTR